MTTWPIVCSARVRSAMYSLPDNTQVTLDVLSGHDCTRWQRLRVARAGISFLAHDAGNERANQSRSTQANARRKRNGRGSSSSGSSGSAGSFMCVGAAVRLRGRRPTVVAANTAAARCVCVWPPINDGAQRDVVVARTSRLCERTTHSQTRAYSQ